MSLLENRHSFVVAQESIQQTLFAVHDHWASVVVLIEFSKHGDTYAVESFLKFAILVHDLEMPDSGSWIVTNTRTHCLYIDI